jgi:hypothetical protein
MKTILLCLAIVVSCFGAVNVYKPSKTVVNTFANFNAYVTAKKDTATSLQIGNNWTISGKCTVGVNIDLNNFVGGGRFYGASGSAVDTLLINRMSARPMSQIFDTSLTVLFASGSVDEVRPEWWGARGDSVTDCAAPIRVALVAARGAPVKFSTGKYLINSSISLNGLIKPKLIGTGYNQSFGTVFYCKNISGYTLQLTSGSLSTGLEIRGILFDGANGNTGDWTNYSSTWYGALTANASGSGFGNLLIEDCAIQKSKVANARGVDLNYMWFITFNRTYITHFPFGYAVYSSPASFYSTTYTFNKCYFTYVRQCGFFAENSGITFNDCVFESCVAGIATAFVANTSYYNCHFEHCGGYDLTLTGIKKGLSPKINYESTDTMNTAIYDHVGNVTMVGCRFLYNNIVQNDTTSTRGWFEGSGSGSIYGGHGSAKFINCSRGIGVQNLVPFFYNSYNNKTRSGYKYIIEDAMEAHTRGGILKQFRDIRKVDKGYCQVSVGTNLESIAMVEINQGKIKFGTDLAKTYTGRPYFNLISFDTNKYASDPITGIDSNIYFPLYEVGDEVKITNPTQYGYEKVICTERGIDAPVWLSKTTNVLKQLCVPTIDNGKYYMCALAGRSKGTEPTWSTTINDTIVDSLCKWVCVGNAAKWSQVGYINNLESWTASVPVGKDTITSYYQVRANEVHEWKLTTWENNILRGNHTITVGNAQSGLHWNVEGDEQNDYLIKIIQGSSKYAISVANESPYGVRVILSPLTKYPGAPQ